MQPPEPTEFGLSTATASALDDFEDRSPRFLAAFILVGLLSGVGSGLYHAASLTDALLGSVFFGLFGCALAWLPALFLGAFWDRLAGLFSPTIRAYSKYRIARREYRSWLLRTRMDFWRSLQGVAFERELGALYAKVGYGVTVTPPSGDDGIDLILKREGKTIIVQCKNTKNPVGPAVIRELYGTLQATDAEGAVLASLSGWTVGVTEFARGKPIQLLAIADVLRLQDSVTARQ